MCVSVVLTILLGATAAADLVYETVEAKEGSNSKMICDMTPMYLPDRVNLLLWYRGNALHPFYKYDTRNANPERDSDSSGSKYHLQILNDDRAELSVASVTILDEDIYHCRVEFFRSSSTVTHVNFTVIGK
ncbi:hypothetical protein Trydic_g1121 [Trypoxylus dichotomus]